MRLFIIAFLISVPGNIFSQISGIVMDKSSGYPVQNAFIRVENENIWTLSDIQGKFLIEKDISNKTLIISAIGFTSEYIIADREFLRIDLKTKVYTIPEIFVTAEKSKTDSLKTRAKKEY